MNIVILSSHTGWQTDELLRAMGERGHVGCVLPYEGLVARVGRHSTGALSHLSSARTSILDADAVLARIIPTGSLEQIIYRVDALHWVEDRGVPVMNSPRTIERCVDKFYTTALLQEAGIPVPETVVCEGAAAALDACRAMGDAIVKPIFGSLGRGMIRVTDPEVALRVVEPLEQVSSVFYVQRTIDHGGRDVRVFIVGGRVVGAIERIAPAGEWRTNVARGGAVKAIDLLPAWAEMALSAAAVVGADYAGVDVLQSRDGEVFVLEVNGIPGWKGLQQATGIDVAGTIVEHLIERVRNTRQASGLSGVTEQRA
ncbi:MAG: RimK family alpha-L-glutamate ligase [Acidobacteria bacterium]|nr:RimK family alpha-L-glutamate ligase [Acidobacteriota bacterium]